LGVALLRGDLITVTEYEGLLCEDAWTSLEFQVAVMEHLVNEVGKGTGSFRVIADLYEAIQDELSM
jgi:Zn-finger domain-containing protein